MEEKDNRRRILAVAFVHAEAPPMVFEAIANCNHPLADHCLNEKNAYAA